MGISFFTTSPVEDVVNVSPDVICFQNLFFHKDKDHLKTIVLRAEKAGVKGFIITADEPVLGKTAPFKGGSAAFAKYLKLSGVKYHLFHKESPDR